MKKFIKIAAVVPVLLALLLAGCSLDDPADPTGQVNGMGPGDAPTQFITIGNSLTAGFMDSGLMKAGQASSFGLLIASQMGVDYDQPWIDAPGIGTTTEGIPDGLTSGVLHYNGTTVLPLGTTPTDEVKTTLLLAAAVPTPYHNLGVPGARVDELLTTYDGASSFGAAFGDTNSFFDIINRASFFGNIDVPADAPAPAFATASQFGQAVAKGALLSTVFIGGNDFLFGAVTGDPIDSPLITDPTVWGGNYAQFIGAYAGAIGQRLGFDPTTQEGLKPNIVVATLPTVANITFFLSLADFEQVFGTWDTTESNVEYILITDFLAWFMDNLGGTMPTTMTLNTAEVFYLDNTIIGAYNTIIQGTIMGAVPGTESFPALANFGLANIDAALETLDPEATQHFLYLRAKYASNPDTAETIADTAARTYFSLDGVHPNNKGYVFMANTFLAAINELTGSSYIDIPLAAVTWDPTYGVPIPTAKSGTNQWPVLSPEVAQGMKEIWR